MQLHNHFVQLKKELVRLQENMQLSETQVQWPSSHCSGRGRESPEIPRISTAQEAQNFKTQIQNPSFESSTTSSSLPSLFPSEFSHVRNP